MKGRPLAAALVLLCALAAPAAAGATLYVARTLVADPGALHVRDLVSVPGGLPADAAPALERAVATVGRAPVSIPARLYAGLVEDALGPGCIFVGSRTLVIPRGLMGENEARLLAMLADFLDQQGLLGEGRVELQAAQPLPAFAQEAAPGFRVVRSERGPSGTEVTCSIAASDPARAPAVAVLRLRASAATAGDGVRAGDPVLVRFRRGPLAIEMQGKALATAGFGDTVAVYIPDSQKRFSGLVIGTKAVDVELP